MKNINYTIFKRTARNYSKKNPRERRFVDYENAKSILLLYECNTKKDSENILEIANRLKSDNKKVEIIAFCPQKNSVLPNSSIIQVFSNKETSITKKPSKELLDSLKAKQFDIVINLCTDKLLPVMYMVLYSNAPFKIGTYTYEPELYDFILSINPEGLNTQNNLDNSNLLFIFNEIFFYLKGIKSKD